MSSLQSHIPGYFLREPIQRSFRHSELGLDVSLLFSNSWEEFTEIGRDHGRFMDGVTITATWPSSLMLIF